MKLLTSEYYSIIEKENVFYEKKVSSFLGILLALLFMPKNAFAMHIMEGFLPPIWCISWGAIVYHLLL